MAHSFQHGYLRNPTRKIVHAFVSKLILYLCIPLVLGQRQPGLSFSTTVSSAISQPSTIRLPTATSVASSTSSPQPSPPAPCIAGNNVGSFYIFSPNTSSYLFAGQQLNITFAFSSAVTIFPVEIQVKYASALSSDQWKNTDTTFKLSSARPSLSNITTNSTLATTQSLYTIPFSIPKSISDGTYFLRLVPDNKEIIGVSVTQLPCFANGMVMPTTSAKFIVLQPVSLVAYPDTFGPNSITSSGNAHQYSITSHAYLLWICAGLLWITRSVL